MSKRTCRHFREIRENLAALAAALSSASSCAKQLCLRPTMVPRSAWRIGISMSPRPPLWGNEEPIGKEFLPACPSLRFNAAIASEPPPRHLRTRERHRLLELGGLQRCSRESPWKGSVPPGIDGHLLNYSDQKVNCGRSNNSPRALF